MQRRRREAGIQELPEPLSITDLPPRKRGFKRTRHVTRTRKLVSPSPSRRRAAGERVSCSAAPIAPQRCTRTREDVIVPKPQHATPLPRQSRIALVIMVRNAMLITIGFNHDAHTETDEAHDTGTPKAVAV